MTTGSGQELPITRDILLDVHLAQATETNEAGELAPAHCSG